MVPFVEARDRTLTVRFEFGALAGRAGALHNADLLAEPRPRVVECRPVRPALVLGSRHRPDIADCAACVAAGVDVAKRRSGGGAVLVVPGQMCWFDVIVPAGEPGFVAASTDVGASMRWMGARIVDALSFLGVDEVQLHGGPMVTTAWSELVCFDGVGPGEVLSDDGKLVGISQRRTRSGSRFQCMVHARWDPERFVGLLAEPRPAVSDLSPVAALAPEIAVALPGAVAGALSAATS